MIGKTEGYAILVEPLSAADGGGWLACVPDLPGCASDGESPDEALKNVQGAIESWLAAAEEIGRPVPVPGSSPGQWRQRVPRTLHATLKRIAGSEGVSLNTLVMTILAESVGKRFGSDGPPAEKSAH